MTEQEMNHPTQGRRRRHKSPSSISSAPPMPVPRLAVKRPSPDDESQPRIKEEREEEGVTPKSEAATVGTKDEPAERDSEDSLRPEQMGEELPQARRLIAEFPPSADSTPRQLDEQRGATAPCTPRV